MQISLNCSLYLCSQTIKPAVVVLFTFAEQFMAT